MPPALNELESATAVEIEPPLRRPHALNQSLDRSSENFASEGPSKHQKALPACRNFPTERANQNGKRDVRNVEQRNNNQDNRHRQGYNQDRQGYNQDRQGYNQDRQGRGFNRDRKGHNQGGRGHDQDRKGLHNQYQRRPHNATQLDNEAEENWEENKKNKDVASYPKSSSDDSKDVKPNSNATANPKVKDVSNATESKENVEPKIKINAPNEPEAIINKKPSETKGPVMSSVATTPVPRAKTTPKVEEKPLVPAKCLVDLFDVGATLLVSIESEDEESKEMICLTLHSDFQEDYLKLCEEYTCDADDKEFCASVGTSFSFRPSDEAAWYRARLMSPTQCALLDVGRVVTVCGGTQRALIEHFAQPEFSAALSSCRLQRPLLVGDQLKCVIEQKSSAGVCKVSVTDMTTNELLGQAELKRWLPKIEYPPPKPTVAAAPVPPPAAAPVLIPEVSRPSLAHKSSMEIVYSEKNNVLLRACDDTRRRQFDMIEQDVAAYALKDATPLKEPPSKGDTLIAQFTDGLYYRALCKRTNVNKNKYLLEYVEYGNLEISCLEKLFECPPQFNLKNRPALTSRAVLQGVSDVSEAAEAYLTAIKDNESTVIVSLPNNEESAPSGSEVILNLAKNKENINKKVEEMSKPEWKKVEEKGGDMFDLTPMTINAITYLPLEDTNCRMKIIDCSLIQAGVLSVSALTHLQALQHSLGPLTEKIQEYCNSKVGSEPYLPRVEEICIAKCPPYEQWFRAAFCEHIGGPGGATASLLYLDFGNVETVSIDCIRRCPMDFASVPVAVCNVEIQGFPDDPTAAQLAKAREYLNIEDGNGGELTATKCTLSSHGIYTIEVPELIAAMNTA